MCGIAGIFHSNPSDRIDPQLLVNMAAIQYHRGPDGFGYKTIEQQGVGFSHARLSIIDLNEERSRQPFLSEDGNLLLAHNGEFRRRDERLAAFGAADGLARAAVVKVNGGAAIGAFYFHEANPPLCGCNRVGCRAPMPAAKKRSAVDIGD